MNNKQWSEWIEWNGGECPLPDGAAHEVQFRDGGRSEHSIPEIRFWQHDGDGCDIVAYRYQLPDYAETPEEKEEFERIEARLSADMVNHPPHYTQGGIECIEGIRAALTPEEFRGYCKGNALKYVWREMHKGGDESMRKASWYINQATEESALRAGELGE